AHIEVRDIQRLCLNITSDVVASDLSERGRIDALWRQFSRGIEAIPIVTTLPPKYPLKLRLCNRRSRGRSAGWFGRNLTPAACLQYEKGGERKPEQTLGPHTTSHSSART